MEEAEKMRLDLLDSEFGTTENFLRYLLKGLPEDLVKNIIERELYDCDVKPDTKPSEYIKICYKGEIDSEDLIPIKDKTIRDIYHGLCVLCETTYEILRDISDEKLSEVGDWIGDSVAHIFNKKYVAEQYDVGDLCGNGECMEVMVNTEPCEVYYNEDDGDIFFTCWGWRDTDRLVEWEQLRPDNGEEILEYFWDEKVGDIIEGGIDKMLERYAEKVSEGLAEELYEELLERYSEHYVYIDRNYGYYVDEEDIEKFRKEVGAEPEYIRWETYIYIAPRE